MLEVLPEFTGTRRVPAAGDGLQAREEHRFRDEARSDPFVPGPRRWTPYAVLTEPAELALVAELARRQPVIERVLESGDHYRQAFAEAAGVRSVRGPILHRMCS